MQESIRKKRLAKKRWDIPRDEESKQEYKEMRREAKKEVAKAKSKAYDELYEGLDTKEGEKTLYRLARQRHQAGKDVQQVRMMKDKDGNVTTDDESVLRMWKEYYMGLMNEENERERREIDGERVNLEVESVSKEEVMENMQRMKNGKAVGPDDIPVEVWKCLGVRYLISLPFSVPRVPILGMFLSSCCSTINVDVSLREYICNYVVVRLRPRSVHDINWRRGLMATLRVILNKLLLDYV